MAAGLLAGLLAGLFAFVTGEPLLDQAIGLEQSAHAHAEGEEAFSRSTQKVGLFFATGFSGAFVGGLFGLAFAYFRGRLASESDWSRSLSLAAAIFAGAALIPFLKYPANPPTIGARTTAYFAMVGLSLLAVLGAWYASGLLKRRGVSTPLRHVTVGLWL